MLQQGIDALNRVEELIERALERVQRVRTSMKCRDRLEPSKLAPRLVEFCLRRVNVTDGLGERCEANRRVCGAFVLGLCRQAFHFAVRTLG